MGPLGTDAFAIIFPSPPSSASFPAPRVRFATGVFPLPGVAAAAAAGFGSPVARRTRGGAARATGAIAAVDSEA